MKQTENTNTILFIMQNACTDVYLGEKGCRITEQTDDQSGKDKQLHLLKYVLIRNHRNVDLSNMLSPVSITTS